MLPAWRGSEIASRPNISPGRRAPRALPGTDPRSPLTSPVRFPEVVCPPQDHLQYVAVTLKHMQGRGARCLADSVKTPRPHSPLCPGHRRCSPTASLGVGVQSSGHLPRFAPSERPSMSVSFPPAPRLAQGDRAPLRAIAMWPAAFYCVTQPRGRARGSRNL